mmetsp:Transcript_25770/g.74151  ORF Transcript_25770/g.74151 Transcript_25770/m.74151 type:complete len:223 (-) Transcript_25770:738-1406(-)
MGQGRVGVEAKRDIHLEQARDEVFRLLRDVAPPAPREAEAALLDHAVRRPVVAPAKGRLAIEQDVGENAERPQVALLVIPQIQDFRRHIVEGAASMRHRHVATDDGREPEVNELESRVRGIVLQAKVLQLQVTVTNPVSVAVPDGCDHLPHKAGGVALRVSTPPRQVVEEVGAPHTLHGEAELSGLLEHLEQPTNIGVVHGQLVLDLGHHLSELLLAEAFCR